jgi:hypothetical protein
MNRRALRALVGLTLGPLVCAALLASSNALWSGPEGGGNGTGDGKGNGGGGVPELNGHALVGMAGPAKDHASTYVND